jgi:hypothetical protein
MTYAGPAIKTYSPASFGSGDLGMLQSGRAVDGFCRLSKTIDLSQRRNSRESPIQAPFIMARCEMTPVKSSPSPESTNPTDLQSHLSSYLLLILLVTPLQ